MIRILIQYRQGLLFPGWVRRYCRAGFLGLCVDGQVRGATLDFMQCADDHDDKAGRVLSQELPDDFLGKVLGFLVAHAS